MSDHLGPELAQRRVVALTGALFLSYLSVAMSLPAVPVHVVQELGFSNAFGGLAVGIAFLSTILTRTYAGARADRIGGKLCMQQGLIIYAAAGLVCLLANASGVPEVDYAILIAG